MGGSPIGILAQTVVPSEAIKMQRTSFSFSAPSFSYGFGVSMAVNAKTVTSVVATADYWDLNSDAGCGDAGCVPGLVTVSSRPVSLYRVCLKGSQGLTKIPRHASPHDSKG